MNLTGREPWIDERAGSDRGAARDPEASPHVPGYAGYSDIKIIRIIPPWECRRFFCRGLWRSTPTMSSSGAWRTVHARS